MARGGEDVRVVAAAPSGDRRLAIRWVAVAVVALLLGFVLGRASDDTRVRVPEQPTPGPYGSAHGVPSRFARSETGAVAALLSHGAALGDPRVLLDARRRAQVLAVVATPSYARTFQGRGAAALEAVRSGPLGRSLAAGARAAYFATPIAYRVVSYSPKQAVVEGWGVSVVADDNGIEPQATWGKTLTSVRWHGGDWRIDAVESKDGPTPSLAAGQAPSSAADFFVRLDGLRGVRHAP
jgi:hypothetical protein